MSEEKSYKERLAGLNAWMPEIVGSIKKDLKNEHLKKDIAFCKKYFPGKNINKITTEEFVDAYSKAIAEEEAGEAIAEFIIQHWILANSEMYHFFEERLSKINPDFTAIKELSSDEAAALEKASFEEFGAINTYIFSEMNGVAFSQEHLKKMEQFALKERKLEQKQQEEESQNRSYEDLKATHAREIARLTDKYEKKLVGFQKKYTQDVANLKKQLSHLQRKMALS